MTRYIFITGGVVSSLGKGITAASLAAVLEARRLSVTMLKLDPYIYQCSGREKSAWANFPGYDWGRPSPSRCGLPCNNMYCENEPVVSGNDDKTKSFWDGGPSKS